MVEHRIEILEMKNTESFEEKDLIKLPLGLRGGGPKMPFKVAAFKSSFPIVNVIATMFRSLEDDWSHFSSHLLDF